METYQGQVKIAFKHNPLPFHKDAPLAHEASIEAAAQGKFWEYHDKLFQSTKKLKRSNLDTYAQELGLDMAKFKAALDGRIHKKVITADMKQGKAYGIRGTPGFLINGKMLSGAQPFPKFKAAIDQEIKAVDALVAKGTKLSDAYAARLKVNLKKGGGDKGKRAKVDDNILYKVPVGDSVAKGPKEALVTIVEFSDYQ